MPPRFARYGGNPPTVSLAPNVNARSVSAISNMTPTLTNVANSTPSQARGSSRRRYDLPGRRRECSW
jgi:hypothetical protein